MSLQRGGSMGNRTMSASSMSWSAPERFDLDLTRRHEWGWRMFATMAEKVFDLARETVR